MTRNIQCREMIEDVQRQVAGLSFQDKNNGSYNSNYPPVGNQNQRSNTQTDPSRPQTPYYQPDQRSNTQTEPSRPQTPYYQPAEQPPVPAYGHHHPPYGHHPPPPYQIPPPTSAAPYPPPQVHQQPPASHD